MKAAVELCDVLDGEFTVETIRGERHRELRALQGEPEGGSGTPQTGLLAPARVMPARNRKRVA